MFKRLLKLEHRHRNLLFMGLGLGVAIWLGGNAEFGREIERLGYLGSLSYLGAIVAGLLFSSTFTVGTGIVILLNLAKILPLLPLIFFASIGAVIGDYLILKFVEDEVADEVAPIYEKITGSHLKKILHTRFFGWTLAVLGALIILSPLPDELGISLLGLEKIKPQKFLLISLVSHLLGISLICQIGRI